MSNLKQIFVTFVLVHLCNVCTALALTQSPPSGEPVAISPNGSAIVSTRTCNVTDSHSFRVDVGWDGARPTSVQFYQNDSLSYYDAQETGYAVTDWKFHLQCIEVAARVFNIPNLGHRNITIKFVLLNRETNREEIDATIFDIDLLSDEVTPTATAPITSSITSRTASEPTVTDEPTTAQPSTVTSLTSIGLSTTEVSAIVVVSVAVAIGSVVCASTVVVITAMRNRRHNHQQNN